MIQLSSVLAQETPLLFLCPCNRLRGSKHFVLFTLPHHRSFPLIPLASLWPFSGFVPTCLGHSCSKVPRITQCNATALQGTVTLESTQPGRHMDQLSSSFARHQVAHQLTSFDSHCLTGTSLNISCFCHRALHNMKFGDAPCSKVDPVSSLNHTLLIATCFTKAC